MTLGARVRQHRLELGLTTVELARRAEISNGYLSKIERGVAPRPSAEVLDRLARTLGTSSAELIGRAAPAEPVDVPSGLRRFAAEARLPDEEVQMLARIELRGRRPRTERDWRFLLECIERSIDGRPD